MILITELKLRIGAGPSEPPLQLPIEPSITVFVGPNNSGKSLILREIAGFCAAGSSTGMNILDRLEFRAVDELTARGDLDAMAAPLGAGEANRPDRIHVVSVAGYEEIHVARYFQARANPAAQPGLYAQHFARHMVRHLDGSTRLNLLSGQATGDLKRPTGILSRLLVDDTRRALIRERIHSQLGFYFALDITATQHIAVRLGDAPPPTERSFEESTIEYMRGAPPVEAFSDGVRAFCGMMAAIHVGLPRIIIVDEPEAFLAPPLAHALGKELATAALTEGKQIFASTHSSHFLMGAISAGARVNIIRLTYSPGTATARLLAASDLARMMNDPMLRSANVLSALFYRGVVVGEADADRAFYQECNDRMLGVRDPRSASDTLFLNANGKDVVPMIVLPLRRLGIPAVSIVDLDVVKKGGEVWTRHLKASGISESDFQPFGQRRQNFLTALDAADPNWKRNGGVGVLSGSAMTAAQGMLNELERYGLFVVARGEIEAWLSDLEAPRDKTQWLRGIFEKMGNDPSQPDYVLPAPGDVWDFLGSVASWLKDGNRHGMS